MNDEHTTVEAAARRTLEARLARRPELRERLHVLLDMLDHSVSDEGCDAHGTEVRVIEQMRQLGQEVLGQWAREAHTHTQLQVPRLHPEAVSHGKKNS